MAIQHYRSIFLSDFHMGAKSFDAKALLDFLRSTQADRIYLIGDIFDGWKWHKRWYWEESYSEILDELVQQTYQGTKITYLPGNHDEEIRRIPPICRHLYAHRLGIKIKDRAVHTLADGRRMLVLHGDQFDRKILSGPVSRWSDHVYEWVLDLLNAHHSERSPKVLDNGDVKPFSLAKYLRKHGQKALTMLNNFETSVYNMVKQEGLDGLICGHTHIATVKYIRDICYANSGDWIRTGHHALAEREDGELELVAWPSTTELAQANHDFFETPPAPEVYPAYQYRPVTKRIIKELKRIWPSTDDKKPKKQKTKKFMTFGDLTQKACEKAGIWAMPSLNAQKERQFHG